MNLWSIGALPVMGQSKNVYFQNCVFSVNFKDRDFRLGPKN